ncbi:MAG: glutamate synthase large subunit, partial [Usitatibacter sp.]
MDSKAGPPPKQGLYDPRHEHDACGVGFVAHIKGRKSHDIVEKGLTILNNLRHRGATGADPLHGDGAGLLVQIPDGFFREEMIRQGVKLPKAGAYGVGMVFLPRNPAARAACVREIERAIANEGQNLLGWREVPVDDSTIGPAARSTMPVIRQVFVGAGRGSLDRDAFERKLYIVRKSSGHAIRALGLSNANDFYVPSFSHRTIVYKGMLLAEQVRAFFTDLSDKRFTSALCLAHQRFSTNTFPTWDLAHPFRYIAHNGEINTLQGNLNWIRSRQATIHSKLLGDDLDKIWPLIYDGQSDSASFDNALELLVMGGYPIAHAMMLMIPEAWAGNPLMDAKRRAFYEYHAALMEPWDGPAAVAFTDGKFIGATLDRNGLRPARYFITDDDLIVMSSEMGVLDIPQEKIIKKWRLQPGKMLLVDIEHGRIVSDEELKRDLAAQRPYQDWLDRTQIRLEDLPTPWEIPTPDTDKLLDRQQAFGYTQEDLRMLMTPMAIAGEEAIGSMGDDSPLAVLSNRAKPLYSYFRQLFAQVTNPPIDPIREQLVMSLVSFIGPRPNLLSPDQTEPVMRLEVSQPILTFEDMEKLRRASTFTQGHFKSEVLTMCYPADWGVDSMEPALAQMCAEAEDAVKKGTNIIILTDRDLSAALIPIPALLATAAVHHHLVRAGLRTRCGLVVETGSAREVHHFACLAGFGAEAIHPNLAFATLMDIRDALPGKVDEKEIVKRYIKAIGKGLLKVMSKMGISTYQSYCGAQIFEAVGLATPFVEKYFSGTPTAVEGIGLKEVAEEAVRLHRLAYSDAPLYREQLDPGGDYAYRIRGEAHMWTPDSIAKLQHATRANSFATFREYSKLIDDQSEKLLTLRGLFRIRESATPVPLAEVEPAKEIVKRFATGAMSLGSISHEAHSTLAIAMNRIGGKSNTGEGGEDPIRYVPLPNGDSMRSAIKQVAAGRFGVTTEYLVNADDLQIKMAQGAKPGEGGQLPGHKVSKYIAKVRHTVPGVGLISPPPHHDIYSIEDLAQLIHDLKNVNPKSRVSVKLVSEIGVGTVAAGVAKAKADHVTISGHDGGTGASPLSSVKYAGSPWEIGLAETQQTLVLNKLRGRIAVQADG